MGKCAGLGVWCDLRLDCGGGFLAAVVRVGEHGRGIRGGCGEDGHH